MSSGDYCDVEIAAGRLCGIRRHGKIKRHNDSYHRELKCEVKGCNLTFQHVVLMREHAATDHPSSGRFICDEEISSGRRCGLPCTKKNNSRHMKQYHSKVICREDECHLYFDHKVLEEEHYVEAHRVSCDFKDNNGKVCRFHFTNSQGMLMHKIQIHGFSKDDGICRLEIAPGRICEMNYGCNKKKTRHIFYNHSEIRCRVWECDRTFVHKVLMEEHYMATHVIMCNVQVQGVTCNRQFTSYQSLVQHHVKGHGIIDDMKCKVEISAGVICQMSYSKHKRVQHNKNWHNEVECGAVDCDLKFEHNQLRLDHFEEKHQKYWRCKNHLQGCRGQFTLKSKLEEHEKTCDPTTRLILVKCDYNGCEKRYTLKYLQCHLALVHHLDYFKVIDHIKKLSLPDGEKDDDDDDDDDDDEEYEPVKVNQLDQFPTIPIPNDPDTGVPYDILKFGLPKWHFEPLDYELFLVFYHFGLRLPTFTYQILTAKHVCKKLKEQTGTFPRPSGYKVDQRIPKLLRRGGKDFVCLPEFHRGHAVRYADYSLVPPTAIATMLYSNLFPMFKFFNLKIWKRIEFATEKFAQNHVVTFVVTAGLFSDPIRMEGKHQLPIPNRYTKIMLGLNETTKRWDLRVYDVEHTENCDDAIELDSLYGNLKNVEQQLGVELFPGLNPVQLGTQDEQNYNPQESQLVHRSDIVTIC